MVRRPRGGRASALDRVRPEHFRLDPTISVAEESADCSDYSVMSVRLNDRL
jgi:hypothetical protein